MQNDSHDITNSPETIARPGLGRTALVAATGGLAAIGMIVGLGVVSAGAQPDPVVTDTPAPAGTEVVPSDHTTRAAISFGSDGVEVGDGELATDPEWAAYDECIDAIEFDEVVFDGSTVGSAVWVDSADGGQMIEFGAKVGTVTVTGTADGIEIVDADGVEVLDEAALDAQWAEMDEAWAACDQHLPEGLDEEISFGDMATAETELRFD